MFFFAFFWGFFHSSIAPVYNIGGVWPPRAISTINTYTVPLTKRGQDSYSGYQNLAQCIFSCRKIPQLPKSLQSVCVVFFAFVILQNGGGSKGSQKSGLIEFICARKAVFWILKPSIDVLQLSNYRKRSLYSGRPWSSPSNQKYAKYQYRTTCTTVSKSDSAESREKTCLENSCYNNEMAPKVLLLTWNNLVEEAFSSQRLLAAYYEIKSKPGNLTPGTDNITFSGINKDWFEKTSASLIDGSFRCPKRLRIYIPKTGSKSMRPINITPPRLKIIEKSILNALQPLFEGKSNWSKIKKLRYDELLKDPKNAKNLKTNKSGYFYKYWVRKPIFSTFSYGFRPKLSAHNALQTIKSWPKNTVWLIKLDVEKAFDKVNHNRLKNIFLKHCPFHQIWNVIKKFIKADIIDFNKLISSDLGVAQGSPLSPLLFNIYLTELDNFVEKLKAETFVPTEYKQQKKIINEYSRFQNKFSAREGIASSLEKYGSPELVLEAFKKEKKEFYKKHGRSRGVDTLSRSILYTRYADDFLIGIVGPKLFAVKTTKQIKTFILGNLKLNIKDTKIINRNEAGVKFLGFIVYLPQFRKKAKVKRSEIQSIKKYIKRSKARVAAGLARSSKAFYYALRGDIIRSLDQSFAENSNSKLENLIENKFILSSKSLKVSKKRRHEMVDHFRNLFSKNFSLAMKSFNDNFKSFLADKEFKNMEITSEIHLAVKNFLNELKNIETKIEDDWLTGRRKTALEHYEKKSINKNSVWSRISSDEFTRTIDLISLQTLNYEAARQISIKFSRKDFYNKLRDLGYVHPKKNRSIGKTALIKLADHEIIMYFNLLIRGYLNWYRCADNTSDVKNIWYILVKSCLLTLCRKHNKDFSWALATFTHNVSAEYSGKKFSLPDKHFITHFGKKFMINEEVKPVCDDSLYKKFCLRLHNGSRLFSECCVQGCDNPDIEIHHIRKLHRVQKKNDGITVLTTRGKRVKGLAALLSSLNRKYIPLCSKHHLEFEAGQFLPLCPKTVKSSLGVNLEDLNYKDLFYK
jgi:retron-type reverse transcriptase